MGKIHAKIGKYLTRLGLEEFYQRQLSDQRGLVLEVGAGSQVIQYNDAYKVVRMDIQASESIDLVADAHAIPVEDCTYDAVISKEVLEHLYHPHVAVREMFRVLKPGGRFIGTTCFYWPIHGAPHDYFRFTRFGLQELFRQWQQVRIVPKNGLLGVMGIHLVRLAGKESIAVKLLYPLIIGPAALLIYVDRRIRKPSDSVRSVTSGYYITAVKPGREE